MGRNASHRIPIIALTAHAMKGYSDRCIEAGMDAYLSKPFTAEQIAETMGAALLWTPMQRLAIAEEHSPNQSAIHCDRSEMLYLVKLPRHLPNQS